MQIMKLLNTPISEIKVVSPIIFVNETKEPFDDTKWREEHLDQSMDVRSLSKKAMEYSENQNIQ